MSRLHRETNPTPGFRAGVLPQHQKSDGTFAVTGENNPLPVANYTQNESGLWVPVNQTNPLPTKLTGSIVIEEYLVNKLVTSGSYTFLTFDVRGGAFGIAIRWDAAIDFEIDLAYVRKDSTNVLASEYRTILTAENKRYDIVKVDAFSGRARLRIMNQSANDQTIEFVNITHFL